MWAKALKTIPRISKEEWLELDVISRWLIATRSAVLIMTAISGILGGLLAYLFSDFNWSRFVVAVISLTLAHAANNLINDYMDYRKGVDQGNYYRSLYGPQPLEHGFMTVARHMTYFLVTLGLALAGGLYLFAQTDTGTLYLIAAGLFFLLFYTWPLKYIALGEPTVLLVWGPLMIGGTYYVVSGGVWSTEVALIGLTYAIGPTTVLFGKHTDKLAEDRQKKIYTMPVLLGEKASRYTTLAVWLLQYVLIFIFVFTGVLGWPLLLVLLALPKLADAWKVFSKPRPQTAPADLLPGVWPLYLSANAFAYNKRFSLLFLGGLILHVLFVKTGIL